MIQASKIGDWMTVDEVADALGVQSQTVYSWIRRRKVAAKDFSAPGQNRPALRIHREVFAVIKRQVEQRLPVFAN